MGVYPDVTLAEARARRDSARKLVTHGSDPGLQRKTDKLAALIRTENNFEAVAREWHEKRLPKLTAGHATQIINALTREVFPVVCQNSATPKRQPIPYIAQTYTRCLRPSVGRPN